MKVFFVMVLVMVAGTFPSYGRTESEGTVFNMTLPHESMNNVTVSSSKTVLYTGLFLVMQWPGTFCNRLRARGRQCYPPVPDLFTVHGLWPQGPGGRIDCRDTNRYGHYRLFDYSQLDGSLVEWLGIYWRDLEARVGYSQWFWAKEYKKHGSCTFDNQNRYFRITRGLVENSAIGDLRFRLRRDRRVIPGESRSFTFIRNAIRMVTGITPVLHCVVIENVVQLSEIRFCVDPNHFQLRNCNFPSNCGNSRILLPPANPRRP